MATIVKDKRAVLLRLRKPSRVTSVIPSAKLFVHKGETLVAAPHRPAETNMLRELGFNIPDPMKIHYEWPKAGGLYDPFLAQIETANFVSMNDRCFILNSMGTGKTVSSLWAYDYMRESKAVKSALIVCPLSTMERTWADEVFKTFPHLDATVVYGDRKKRLKLLAQPSNLYIVNTDGLEIIADALAERPDINLIIVDEIAMFRNASTDRWKALNKVINKQCVGERKAWGLTGMPTPNLPTDAWAQCRVICPTNLDVPKYFGKARDQLMRQVTHFKWVPKDDANDVVKQWMQPSIRYALDDVVDLPEQIFLTRDVELSPEQKKAYVQMLSTLKAEYDGGEIMAVNEAVKANKLIQISCGVAYGNDHTDIIIPAPERIKVLKEIISESEGKVIVFIPLTGALEHIAAELAKDWEVGVIHGGTPKAQRDEIFHGFQKGPTPHVIVANPGTMSHGLTLTAATTIIWYAPVHSNDTYEQACARVRRPGQTRSTVIAHIAGSEIERRIYTRLKTKQKMQGLLLDMMKGI
jgi:SNF2 family DNA or RNA helicase